ncbi:unnamed protein product [Arctia plantaginis]|uniref:Uncharacterized protein n=1 Tax=Arctia plantaginis TaxID=874455 RepID=A0A8S1AMT1_ARCPL|nr:unnamed protein product [Arctia plantaginis]CAB3249163.1 unnamed protein product [Arctia plantaginis]
MTHNAAVCAATQRHDAAFSVAAERWSVDFAAATKVDVNMNNFSVICALLEEEEEEFLLLLNRQRKSPRNMFLQRRSEGCYETLIKRHLIDCEENSSVTFGFQGRSITRF